MKRQIEYTRVQLEVEETEDNTQAPQKTFNIYIKGNIYEGLDQVSMKDNPYENELYKAFKKFLEDYFLGRVDFPQENQNDEVLMKL